MGISSPDPASTSRNEPMGMDMRQPHTHCSPGSCPSAMGHDSSAVHLTQHLKKSASVLPFSRDKPAQPCHSPLGRSCWHWHPTCWGPGRARGDSALRGRQAGRGTDRIAGDSSGALDLALLPGSSQTLLAQDKLLPTHVRRRDVNKKLQGKGGNRRGHRVTVGMTRWAWLNREGERESEAGA